MAQAQKQYSAEAKLRHKLDMVEQRERALHLKELEVNAAAKYRLGSSRYNAYLRKNYHKVSIERRKIEDDSASQAADQRKRCSRRSCEKVEADFIPE